MGGMFAACLASLGRGAKNVLRLRTTASPIRHMGTSVRDGWRESSRRRRIAGVGRGGQASSARRLIAAPHVHVIQTRSPSTPPSSSPRYWCLEEGDEGGAPSVQPFCFASATAASPRRRGRTHSSGLSLEGQARLV